MPDGEGLLPDDLKKLLKRLTDRGIAVAAARRIIRLVARGLLAKEAAVAMEPQMLTRLVEVTAGITDPAMARRLSQVAQPAAQAAKPFPIDQMVEAFRNPFTTAGGASALATTAKVAGPFAIGSVLMGGSTPRSPRGLEYGKQYATMYGEPDPGIFGQPEDPERGTQVEAALRRMEMVKPFIEAPTERIPSPPTPRRRRKTPSRLFRPTAPPPVAPTPPRRRFRRRHAR